MRFSFSADRSARSGASSGGKSIDSGLDERGGDVLIHPLDWDSGDRHQAAELDGGVNGIHIGASGDNDEEVTNNDVGRLIDRAEKISIDMHEDVSYKVDTHIERLFEQVWVAVLIIMMELYDSWRRPKRPCS